MDANAKQHFSIFGFVGLSHRNAVLDIRRTLDGIDDTAKLNQKTITHGFHNATPVFVDGRPDDLVELIIETRARTGLIRAHEPRVADHIGRKDRR
jgi:hypothetical protein